MNKILIIVGGNKTKLALFSEPGKKIGVDCTLASFSELHFSSSSPYILMVGDVDVASFDLIYIRMVGKRWEPATLLVNYAKEHSIPVVDGLYSNSLFIPSSLAKSVEVSKLIKAEVPIPRTIFGSLAYIKEHGASELGFPYVIKTTSGQKAREVWSPSSVEELNAFILTHEDDERLGKKQYFAQEFISASQRDRIFVIGGKVVAGVTRPTKWRRRFLEKVDGNYPEGIKKPLNPVPVVDVELALKAVKALELDIAGVDVVHEDATDKAFILEANAAPAWELVRHDTAMNVEEEVLKFLLTKLK